MTADEPLRVALRIDDPVLADRLRQTLGTVAAIRLVDPQEPADAALIAMPAAPPRAVLSPREAEVLALMAEGESNKAIARRLGITAHTVKFHVASLIEKLDAVGRTDAVAHAARQGVIQL